MPNEELLQQVDSAPLGEDNAQPDAETLEDQVVEGQDVEAPEVEDQVEDQSEELEPKRRVDRRNKELNDEMKSVREQNALLQQQMMQMNSNFQTAQTQFQDQLNQVNKGNDPWSNLDADQLSIIAASTEDEGVTKEQRARAYRELAQKAADDKFSVIDTQNKNQVAQVQNWNTAVQELYATGLPSSDPDFDANNQGSEVYKVAQKIFNDKSADAGFAGNPNSQALALREAVNQLSTKKLASLSGENKTLKKKAGSKTKSMQLESGTRAGSTSGSRSSNKLMNEAVATGNWQDVIASRIGHKIPD